jgi:cytochrome c oxidase assembly protein subunit 15
LIGNIVIIITGGLVRLTDSGLGCPTWPQCSPGSYTPHSALGVHGVIEFGNRMITFALIVIAVATFVSAWLHRRPGGEPDRRVRWLTFGLLAGIPVQGVIGGITVLTGLNPYVVALHLLDSMVLVTLSVWLVRLTWSIRPQPVSADRRLLPVAAFAVASMVVMLGTVVTGSGPHAGSLGAQRTGLDVAGMAHVHATAAYVLVAVTLICWYVFRSRAVVALLAVELGQVVVGLTQYFTGLPIALVTLHLLGAASVMAVAANLMWSQTSVGHAMPTEQRIYGSAASDTVAAQPEGAK